MPRKSSGRSSPKRGVRTAAAKRKRRPGPLSLRNALEALRISEEKFQKAFHASPDAININRLSDGAFLEINEAFTRITGFTPGDVMGKSSLPGEVGIWVNASDRERLVEGLKKQGEVTGLEAPFRCKDGRVLYGVMSARIMTINNEPCILSVTRDITEQRRAAMALRESERRFREMADTLPLTVYEADLRGRFTFVNTTAKEWFGYTDAEVEAGLTVLQAIHPEDRAAAAESFKKVVTGQGNGLPNEYRAVRKDGSVIPVLILSRPIYSEGAPAGLRGIVLDISRRKVEEESLRKSEAHYRVLFESIADGVVVHDLKGIIRDLNEKTCAMLGYTKEELLGAHLSRIDGGDDPARITERMERLLRDGILFFEGRHRRKDGTQLDTQVSAKIVTREGAGIILGLIRDVTERKRMEQTLYNAQKLESLGVLAGGIAHDFNNLLGGIFGYADLAREISKDPKVTGYLTSMLEAMDRARALTQQLLTFAKGGAPILKAERLMPFLRDTANFAMSGSNVSWTLQAPPDLWCCRCDLNQVAQVIDNLLINAKQAMPGGGDVSISAANLLLTDGDHPSLSAGRYVRISVADRGPGIPREHLTRIFEPFFTTKDTGSGLGLTTSYSIIRRHAGALDVESEPGNGALFQVTLPACDPEDRTTAGETPPPESRSGRILLMDDEAIIRGSASEMLRQLGYECTAVSDGREALSAFLSAAWEKRPFCAVLLDLNLGGSLAGAEVAAEIRKNDPVVPIIVFSGYADNPAMARPAELGFTDSLGKPFERRELGKVLERNIKKKTG